MGGLGIGEVAADLPGMGGLGVGEGAADAVCRAPSSESAATRMAKSVSRGYLILIFDTSKMYERVVL
jgi:hypothetical protein